MPINRIASRTRSWFALRRSALVLLAASGCSEQVCPNTGQRGSLLVARVDPHVEEGGVAFDQLGDSADSGVALCRDILYADGHALLKLMGDSATVTENNGLAVIGGVATSIPAYRHDKIAYVAVQSFARSRRALVLPNPDHPVDMTLWPRPALLHLKRSGLTQGRAYQTAVREGLLP